MGVVVNAQDKESQQGLCILGLRALHSIPSSCPQGSHSQLLTLLARVRAETLANSGSQLPMRPGLTLPCYENRLRVVTEEKEPTQLPWVPLSLHMDRLPVTAWSFLTHHHCSFTELLL